MKHIPTKISIRISILDENDMGMAAHGLRVPIAFASDPSRMKVLFERIAETVVNLMKVVKGE